ncbi:hypothetical protein SKAU_G00053570 [Synaphobranchus kaupii]|uniref:Uncharacterized protein n=1 Tax=Synaphobranchus kaupii TaxID=118154 RepID=A0A9Q1JA10_SYNKA|nr:hypothetical protein SKAU_G00053570 [Synaphobranchus kaupii]
MRLVNETVLFALAFCPRLLQIRSLLFSPIGDLASATLPARPVLIFAQERPICPRRARLPGLSSRAWCHTAFRHLPCVAQPPRSPPSHSSGESMTNRLQRQQPDQARAAPLPPAEEEEEEERRGGVGSLSRGQVPFSGPVCDKGSPTLEPRSPSASPQRPRPGSLFCPFHVGLPSPRRSIVYLRK